MTANIPPVRAEVVPGSRLESLLIAYSWLKAEADEAAERLKLTVDGIKAELHPQIPVTDGATKIDVIHPALAQPLRMSWVESWRLDTKRLKAEDPLTYVRYASKGGKWELRGVSE